MGGVKGIMWCVVRGVIVDGRSEGEVKVTNGVLVKSCYCVGSWL